MKKKIFTSSYLGLESYLVEVEVDISRGLPMFSIVGMGDTAILESKFRVKAALKNSNYEIVPQKIVVNLSPAGIKKEGAQFDLRCSDSVESKKPGGVSGISVERKHCSSYGETDWLA